MPASVLLFSQKLHDGQSVSAASVVVAHASIPSKRARKPSTRLLESQEQCSQSKSRKTGGGRPPGAFVKAAAQHKIRGKKTTVARVDALRNWRQRALERYVAAKQHTPKHLDEQMGTLHNLLAAFAKVPEDDAGTMLNAELAAGAMYCMA